jgi:SAM-dependent methyltransferase
MGTAGAVQDIAARLVGAIMERVPAPNGFVVCAGGTTLLTVLRARDIQPIGCGAGIHFAPDRLPFRAGSLSMVCCCPPPAGDSWAVAREWARVVKPGGVVGAAAGVSPPDPGAARYVAALEGLLHGYAGPLLSSYEWTACFEDAGLVCRVQEALTVRVALRHLNPMPDAGTLIRARVLLRQAPPAAARWLEPELGEGIESFLRHTLILVGARTG